MNDGHVLRLVFWETTAGCNLECAHCRRLDVSQTLSKEDLDTAQARRTIDAIAEFAKPILVLSGGEPLMRPDIFELARYAVARGLPVALATNGTMIDESTADRVSSSGIRRVSISLDGARAATHDGFRRQNGSFEAALAGLRRLRARRVSVQINTTVTRRNVNELDAIYHTALREGADALHLFMLVPVGCGLEIAEDQMLGAERYEAVLHWLYDVSKEGRIQTKATCAPHYFRIMRQRQKEEGGALDKVGEGKSVSSVPTASKHPSAIADSQSPIANPEPPTGHRLSAIDNGPSPSGHPMHAVTKGCLAGTGVCFVSHKGEVFPCGYLPVHCGDITKQPFREIWEKAEAFRRLRDPSQLEGKCALCEYRFVCEGCRARAYAATGNFMSEEPFCAYQPKRARSREGVS